MPRCPSCSADAPAGARFCPACAAPLENAAASPTRTSVEPAAPEPVATSEGAPFVPGSMLGRRYRIVGMLGRGGMGEVYRADDLKLGQPVALKFLPKEVERDEGRLRRFLNEVRLALRITHPSVCRVHDIGEANGRHFISMEYVDGEDLASLLRRIGRLPQERAIEIARQLCSGLAAAHEEGILHRDLKPANIMIDGRGRARITDFGLADIAGTVHGDEVRAGTPAYMAPEQLDGSGVSERSDIYALGLVLYEMFTGKPAFPARSAAEMARMQQSTSPTNPTTLVKGLDPAIESVVLRAIDADPARRPASALAIAAALPGGDPLAAALAAGETPSPEMVAAAGEAGGMAPGWVALCIGIIVAGMAAIALVRPRADILGWIETPHSVSALRERARLMVERLGFDEAPEATAHGVVAVPDYLEWLRDDLPKMRERVAAERPPAYVLWYRESPGGLVPINEIWDGAEEDDPPQIVPGMVRVRLDPHGRLARLDAVPPDRDPAAETDESAEPPALEALWSALFREAGLDPERFDPAEPTYTPPFFADARAAWEGAFPESPEIPIRVEAAAWNGRPVSFRIIGPWTRDAGNPAEARPFQRFVIVLVIVLFLSVLFGLAVLARRNLHQGRSDVRGALRVGLFIFGIELSAFLIGGGYLVEIESAPPRIALRLAVSTFLGAIIFLAYIALEPYVRRLWPETLISWTRLLSGRLRDPLIGRDILLGAALGVGTRLLMASHLLLPSLLGLPEETLGAAAPFLAIGPLEAVPNVLRRIGGSVGSPMMAMVSLVLLRLLLRNTKATVAVFFVVTVGMTSLGSPHPVLDAFIGALVMAATLVVLLRIGLVAAVAMWLADWSCGAIATLDPSSWVGSTAVVNAIVMLALTGYAAIVALGGRALLQDEV